MLLCISQLIFSEIWKLRIIVVSSLSPLLLLLIDIHSSSSISHNMIDNRRFRKKGKFQKFCVLEKELVDKMKIKSGLFLIVWIVLILCVRSYVNYVFNSASRISPFLFIHALTFTHVATPNSRRSRTCSR